MNNGDGDVRMQVMKGLRVHIAAAHRRKDYARRNDLMRAYDDASLSRFKEPEARFLERTGR